MSNELKNQSSWGKGKRVITGLNVGIMVLVAFGIFVAVNYISSRYYFHRDCTFSQEHTLSDKTKQILEKVDALDDSVKIYTLFADPELLLDSQARNKINDLREEYKVYSKNLVFENINPFFESARIKALEKELQELQYDFSINVFDMIFIYQKRIKIVPLSETYKAKPAGFYGPPTEMESFLGEEVIAGAILNIIQSRKTVVYFVEGHGEPALDDFREGYTELDNLIKRENMVIKKINLLGLNKLPADCDILVLAGPQKKVSLEEQNLLNVFLAQGGKVLIALDPMVSSDLEKFLKKWGVRADNNILVDMKNSVNLRGVPVVGFIKTNKYGRNHPILKKMTPEIMTVFPTVRSVEPVPSPGAGLTAVSLVSSLSTAWGETDFDGISRGETPRYQPGRDKKGPVSLAVAVTKRLSDGQEARLVVFGDSEWLRNNYIMIFPRVDLFMNSLRWLARQESLISIEPKKPEDRSIAMHEGKKELILKLVCFLLPVLSVMMGIAVWFIRRK